jgi:hypothetical protein
MEVYMAKWVVLVESNCAVKGKDDEFNKWYNNVHLVDVLTLREVVRATRYERIAPSEGQARYLAAYEVETDDLNTVMQAVGKNMERWTKEGRISPLFAMTSMGTFKQIISKER